MLPSTSLTLPLKIAIIGPQRVGKTVITNTLAEFSTTVTPDYHPTVGCRILECEKTFSEDQVKNMKLLKSSNTNKCQIELWDISGDKKYETCWPAIKSGLHGVIMVIDSKSSRYDNALDEWVNGFCNEVSMENVICFSYSKDDDSKAEIKQKTCKRKIYISII